MPPRPLSGSPIRARAKLNGRVRARARGWASVQVANVLLVVALLGPFLFWRDCSATCTDCPGRNVDKAWRLRASCALTDAASGWPRWGVSDRAAVVGLATTNGYIDSKEFAVTLRPSRWRANGGEATPGLVALTYGFRHNLVTDHTALDMPVTPSLAVSAGAAHAMQDAHRLSLAGRFESYLRAGLGVDIWVHPRYALYVGVDREWHKPRAFMAGKTFGGSSVRVGIVHAIRDGGRSR